MISSLCVFFSESYPSRNIVTPKSLENKIQKNKKNKEENDEIKV